MRTPARWRGSWIAVAIALSACGGGGEEPVPPRFTAAMVQGKTFYREALTPPDQEKMLITFSSATAVTLWQEVPAGVGEIPATWSIDANGRLVLASGLGAITVTLVADAATSLDITADDGTPPPTSERLYKTIPFGGALPDRFAVADRDFAGAAQTGGVASFGGTGTGVLTDGFTEDSFAWAQVADGSVTLSSATEDNVVHLRADSVLSSPKSLRVVGRAHDAATTDFIGLVDAILTETPAASGFTPSMVEDQVLYRENTVGGNRSIIRYDAGGVREEWYEDTVAAAYRVGTWQVLPLSGSLVALPQTGLSEVAAMLFEDLPSRWDLLVNTSPGGPPVIDPASLTKTVAANPASVPGVWSATERLVGGGTDPLGTITLNGDGSGTGPSAEALHWSVEADGSLLISFDGTTDTITFFALATSLLPNRLELAGAWYSGATFGWTTVLTMTK